MSSIQAYKAHKQEGPPVSKVGSSAHLPKHPYISGCTAYLTTKHFFQLYTCIR